ncbi:MAG: FeS assembly SUF system protein [Ignavibacteria bacterium GWB2_35_12]|nr:MAG: FeS assembly SUF system protein [Ignavibacteria bacterium GWB2_35_12]OGU93045.1 MAG: FeS assembly SUF system protein [Ignavibacteria bacterium RIFOXYA2_FULL_35_10]OGV24737.1 MAG: FeS assembly SUF system protein [Ignavibacteria bacterium RIFOXYC2_FULL_35_21]
MEQNINIEELKAQVFEAIKTVYDPEIPINIFELGLIYDVQITADGEAVILMTLTAPNCPEAMSIPIDVEHKVREIEGIKDAKAIVTFDPPWDRNMMSEAAMLELGFL